MKNITICSFVFFLFFWSTAGASDNNPYQILGVPNGASQEQIKKRYRELCLKYHPDKNVNKSTSERQKCESMFKTIQKANSLIGDEEKRVQYDRSLSPFASAFQQRTSNSNTESSSPFGNDPVAEAIFRAFSSSARSSPQSFYFQRGFSAPRPAQTASNFADSFQKLGIGKFKSIYFQKVKVPLKDLYTGAKGVELCVKDTLWQRYTASFYGGAAYINLYQALMYGFPFLRVGKFLALVVGLMTFHATLPRPLKTVYEVDLQPGYKGGKTKLVFKSAQFGQPVIIFELQEERHKLYKRIENDLHMTITISATQAKKGCIVEIEPLDEEEPTTKLRLEPNQIRQSGDEVRLPGKGWPIRNPQGEYGDIVVRVLVVKRRPNKRKRKTSSKR
jgi:DnaJ-class molecular chaperone